MPSKVQRPPADDGFYVAIPSYKRAELIQRKTLAVLQRHSIPKDRVYIFVASESQYAVYRSALSQEWQNIVIGVPTLWNQRNFITKFFAEGTHILSMDDDVEDLYLCEPLSPQSSPEVKRLPLPKGGVLAKIAANARERMLSAGCFLWSLNVSDNPMFMRHNVLFTNGLCNGFFWGCLNRHDEDLTLKYGDGHEDVERSVRYFQKDGAVLRYSFICATSRCKLNPGGLQASMKPGQRAKEEDRSAVMLVEEFPHLLKLAPGSALGVKFLRNLSDQLAGEEMLSSKELTMLIDQTRTSLLEGAVWAKLRRTINKDRLTVVSGTFHRCTHKAALLKKGCGGWAGWEFGDSAAFESCSGSKVWWTRCDARKVRANGGSIHSQVFCLSVPAAFRLAVTLLSNNSGNGLHVDKDPDTQGLMARNLEPSQWLLVWEHFSVLQEPVEGVVDSLRCSKGFSLCAVRAPDQAIHNLYVKELNMYLNKINRKPDKFKMAVQMRKIEACLSECSSENSNHKSKRRDDTCWDAAWLSILTDEIGSGGALHFVVAMLLVSLRTACAAFPIGGQAPVVYVEGIELFDHKYFQIAINEARGMDPMQRHVLEVGAQNLFKMGITKDIASRTPHHAGVSVGLDKDDYDSLPKTPELQGSANVQAIIANRFSFIFNLKGPNYVADTACSASLTATHLAKFMLRDQTIDKIEFHIALGIHQCLSPFPFVGSSQTHMTSARCRTFNATAGGYMRGDGCSGLTLKPGDLPDERDAIWRGSMVGQNGKSATLTAPNGISQEEVIWKAIREAKISPTESCVWSCHGTGTSLGDPIEVGAVRKIQNKEQRDTTLLVVTNKSQTGHLEGGAAMTSLLAAVFQVKASSAIPCCHLRQLNPHLDQTNFNAVFNSELNSYQYSQGNVHVSSFGFGGTNAHAIFWGENVYHAPSNAELYQKRIWSMSPPEVRVNGSDPALWDWDGPDQVILPGDKYSIEMNPDDPPNAPQRWFKEDTGVEHDEGEDEVYCLTGPFNEWDLEQMEDGPVPGLWTLTVKVPSSGQVEFRILRNGNEDEVIYPDMDKCSQKLTPIHGPSKDDQRNAKNTWLAEGIPGSSIKVDFFSCRGIRSINWMQATPVLM
ncbi:ppsA [Symbiodinium sp. CCMP2592]|nr:ppsA [Symbiodinium sp. CCMP2592]